MTDTDSSRAGAVPAAEFGSVVATGELATRLGEVRRTIEQACARSGREPSSVRLVAVSKTVSVAAIIEAIGCGQLLFGENYVQEGVRKRAELSSAASDGSGEVARSRTEWHLIGHLQRNKVAHAVETFDLIQTVDRIEVAEAIAARAVSRRKEVPILVQVNISGETAKSGVAPERLRELAERIVPLDGVALRGLMCIGRMDVEGELEGVRRDEFRALRGIRDDLSAQLGVPLPELSMGMSEDYSIAVEEGATIVRVGSAIFGARG